jgi:3-hydroxyisobutyrate dehydrogenase-like beta-hydroxyacid dehydrogenase
MATIGLLHPGEMGAAIGRALRQAGHEVLWTSAGRSEATALRATDAGLIDAGSLEGLAERSDVIISVCPPHAATEVAASVAGADGLFVDANAIAPATARVIATGRDSERVVDGGIIGPPPRDPGTTRLYLSGVAAAGIAELFVGTAVDTRVVSAEVGDASAVKMTYAAWTKGTAALLLAIRAVAEAEGIAAPLYEEWRLSLPDLPEAVERATRAATAKGWRWVGEMEEIAATFAAVGQPDGFHRAAAEIYRGK